MEGPIPTFTSDGSVPYSFFIRSSIFSAIAPAVPLQPACAMPMALLRVSTKYNGTQSAWNVTRTIPFSLVTKPSASSLSIPLTNPIPSILLSAFIISVECTCFNVTHCSFFTLSASQIISKFFSTFSGMSPLENPRLSEERNPSLTPPLLVVKQCPIKSILSKLSNV